MSNQCIVVADRARARLFTVAEPEDARFEAGPRLIEHQDLANPEAKLTDEELFRDRRSGRKSRLTVTGGGYALDDKKEHERQESARRFVKDVKTAISDFMRTRELQELVLVASPKFLGLLRSELRETLPKGTELTELAEDLSWHAVPHIEKVLVRRGVLPARELPEVAYLPRAQPRPAKRRPRTAKRS